MSLEPEEQLETTECAFERPPSSRPASGRMARVRAAGRSIATGPSLGSWIVPPAAMAVGWGLALFALFLELHWGPVLAVAGLVAGVVLAIGWTRHARTLALRDDAPPDCPLRYRAAITAVLLLWHGGMLWSGIAYLRNTQLLPLLLLLVLAPLGALWLLPWLGRRRVDDLWAAAFTGLAAAALPFVGWLSATAGWSGEPLRAALWAMVLLSLPLYGALLRPARQEYDAISGLLVAIVLCTVVVLLGARMNTVGSVPLGDAARLGVDGGGGRGEALAAPVPRPRVPSFSVGFYLREASLGRAVRLPLSWHLPGSGEDLPAFPVGANIGLRALDTTTGDEQWYFLDAPAAQLAARPPIFSPSGRYLVVVLQGEQGDLTQLYKAVPGELSPLLTLADGAPAKGEPGVSPWSAGGDAIVLATPTQWQRIDVETGDITAAAPRPSALVEQTRGDALSRFYGCDPRGWVVLGPPLPAKAVFRAFKSPEISEALDLSLDCAGDPVDEVQAFWISEAASLAACVTVCGEVSFYDYRNAPSAQTVLVTLDPRFGPFSLNLPPRFVGQGPDANYHIIPAAGSPWFGYGRGTLGFVINAPELDEAIYFLGEREREQIIVTRYPLPGAVAGDFVSGNDGQEYAARAYHQDGDAIRIWHGRLTGLPHRLRVPLRGSGRLLWPNDDQPGRAQLPLLLHVPSGDSKIRLYGIAP